MTEQQVDRLIHALSDGVGAFAELATRAGVDAMELMAFESELERGINLFQGFYKFAHENMQPAGMPPPKNPYFNKEQDLDQQSPEYYAYEAVQRGSVDRKKCVWICGQFGMEEAAADAAIDHVLMPWRPENGWRTFVRIESNGRFVLQSNPPVKLKRHIERLREKLLAE